VRRALGSDHELDDDPDRIDRDAVHRYLLAYLADVYVLEPHRGHGLGVELVRFAVEEGPHASMRWLLQTDDAHRLYERFGFEPAAERWMERRPTGTRE